MPLKERRATYHEAMALPEGHTTAGHIPAQTPPGHHPLATISECVDQIAQLASLVVHVELWNGDGSTTSWEHGSSPIETPPIEPAGLRIRIGSAAPRHWSDLRHGTVAAGILAHRLINSLRPQFPSVTRNDRTRAWPSGNAIIHLTTVEAGTPT
ncbi:hypothetical protein [Natronoglycomyces albus]|uniref:Uncharacterized protein n=1 Tax=Natronoglycomyces albus TaxID=2811108 RepID=A0A895XKX9_9ACTN|nr:hypothetical protein [Natronoglycomyces albus]QSB04079.1 hypothetical protein JQS30_09635 [Natronoglycomyces albus]